MCISHNDGQRCCNIIHQFHTSSGIFWGDFWLEMFCGNIQKRLFFACFCCFDRADGSLDFSEKEKHDANFPMTFCRAKRLPFGNGILRWGYEKKHTHTHTHTHHTHTHHTHTHTHTSHTHHTHTHHTHITHTHITHTHTSHTHTHTQKNLYPVFQPKESLGKKYGEGYHTNSTPRAIFGGYANHGCSF